MKSIKMSRQYYIVRHVYAGDSCECGCGEYIYFNPTPIYAGDYANASKEYSKAIRNIDNHTFDLSNETINGFHLTYWIVKEGKRGGFYKHEYIEMYESKTEYSIWELLDYYRKGGKFPADLADDNILYECLENTKIVNSKCNCPLCSYTLDYSQDEIIGNLGYIRGTLAMIEWYVKACNNEGFEPGDDNNYLDHFDFLDRHNFVLAFIKSFPQDDDITRTEYITVAESK